MCSKKIFFDSFKWILKDDGPWKKTSNQIKYMAMTDRLEIVNLHTLALLNRRSAFNLVHCS